MTLLCECNFKSGGESDATKVRWMVGPYWNMLIVTYSVLLLITGLVYGVLVPRSIGFFVLSLGLNLSSSTFVLLTVPCDLSNECLTPFSNNIASAALLQTPNQSYQSASIDDCVPRPGNFPTAHQAFGEPCNDANFLLFRFHFEFIL
jgi:hypothetical protein